MGIERKAEGRPAKALPFLIAAGIVLCVVLGLAALRWRLSTSRESVGLTSLSLDGRYRVTLVELVGQLDRNFRVRVEDTSSGASRVVFNSPDEGKPIGTERFLWAADSSAVLLVGRHFYTSATLRVGEDDAYLMIWMADYSVKCNASQDGSHARLEVADLGVFEGR